MEVEIWSDVVCPWCYIGKRRFEVALAAVDRADQVRVRWRSFELDPAAPRTADRSLEQLLAAKYGMTPDQAAAANRRVTDLAAAEGLAYRLDLARPANSFDAHRLLQLADATGHQAALAERLFAAYFTEGATIGDAATLARLASEAGLPADQVAATLGGDAHAEQVRSDEAEARALGVQGVPFFAFDRRLAVAGAQPVEVFARALSETAT